VLGCGEGKRKVILDQDLLEAHLDALFIHDARGRITTTNEPPPDRSKAPRFYLGRSSGSSIWRFRDDLSQTACAGLGDLAAVEPVSPDFRRAPVNSASMADVLASEQQVEQIYIGLAFRFPEQLGQSPDVVRIRRSNSHLLEPEFAWLAPQVDSGGVCLAIIAGGVAVSACWSSRSGGRVCEAGVETLSEHRGRGYATAVVRGWASEVRRLGRTPLYSTSWENTASLRIAERLGLVTYATDFSIR
jgi:hypothetical protein